MSLHINPQGFNQTRFPMNLSERSMLANSGVNGATKSASASAPVQAPATKPMPRFRTLTPPTAPAPKPISVAAARNPYQTRSARSSNDDFVITADSTPADGTKQMPVSSSIGTSAAASPMADRIKDIQNMATQLGYVELSEGAITKAIQNRSSLLANYVV
ncbi:MAG: hypothetical protein QE263_07890 [Vampirovibrionales bacterium]|nr:hypothetical protein [Vampirovibrionales bacterium]